MTTAANTPTLAARTESLRKVYGQGEAEVVALDGVSVGFEHGRFTAVMGASGSGKSTLMHCVAGLDNPTSGTVFIGATEIGRLKDKHLTELRRDRIGFVFQSFNLIPTLTADENILLPLAIAGRKPEQAWYDLIVDTVGLRDRLSHKPSELSGGQQQRVACARALMSKPDIVFADEPTGNLDSRSGAEVLGFLRRSVDEFGQTIVMVTHDPIAAAYTDRVVFLADGRIVDELQHPTRESVLRAMGRLEPARALPTDRGPSAPHPVPNQPFSPPPGTSTGAPVPGHAARAMEASPPMPPPLPERGIPAAPPSPPPTTEPGWAPPPSPSGPPSPARLEAPRHATAAPLSDDSAVTPDDGLENDPPAARRAVEG